MIEKLEIKNFRAFRSLSMHPLSRVNVIVGTNNSGKTSILDALELLLSKPLKGPNDPFFRSLDRRGEFAPVESKENVFRKTVYDTSVIFHGRDLKEGESFSIGASSAKGPVSAKGRITDNPHQDRTEHPWSLVLDRKGLSNSYSITESGWTVVDSATFYPHETPELQNSVFFLSPDSFDERDLSGLWDKIQLSDEKPEVITALKIVAPDVENIAFRSSISIGRLKGLVSVRLADTKDAVPLGSLGSGTKQMLALSLSLVNAKNATFLCDEIDTGFHYSALPAMWKLLIKTAHRLNCQVFATTHSRDCIEALSNVLQDEPEFLDQVCLHRVDSGANETVFYSGAEIRIAGEHYVEVR